MEIKYQGKGKFQITTKEGIIETGEPTKINQVLLNGPGEYEVSSIGGFGIPPSIYLFRAEGLVLAHLGNLARTLNDQEIEKLNDVDILFLPTGSKDVLDAKKALEVINQIDPKIVIPSYFEDLASFCKEEGSCPNPVNVFKVSKQSLPSEERKVVILNASN